MGRIVVLTNVSLDGVIQDPDGQEGFKHGRKDRALQRGLSIVGSICFIRGKLCSK